MKKYDIFGKEVNIGDNVVITEPHYHNFVNAKVIKLTPKGSGLNTLHITVKKRKQLHLG